jgi:hypothetical protein
MNKINFLFLFLLSCTVNIFAQTQKPYIEITGVSEIAIVPNEIYLDICIKERNEKGKKLTIDFLEHQLKSTLKKIGIPEKNLSISDINSVLAKTGWWTEEIFSIANYTLKVNGADKLKQLFENFKKMNISDVTITKATHTNIIEIKKKNRIKAIKADYLLNAIGEKTGKPFFVNELPNNNTNFVTANYINKNKSYSMLKLETNGIKNKVVEFEKIKITSSIYVKFLIE